MAVSVEKLKTDMFITTNKVVQNDQQYDKSLKL